MSESALDRLRVIESVILSSVYLQNFELENNMELIKEFFKTLIKYREYINREIVKIAVVLMEGAGVYLIARFVYDIEEYARVLGAIVALIAYLVSWMKSPQIKKTFAIAYTVFALIGAGLNVSRDYYKSIESNLNTYTEQKNALEAKLPAKLDMNCGKAADWLKLACADKQIQIDTEYRSANSSLLVEIANLSKPTQGISNLKLTTFFRWALVLLIAIAPGFLFVHVSTEEARIIAPPVDIPKKLPDSFNAFADLLESHFGFKKTTVRDWLRAQGWIQPSDIQKIVFEATSKLQSQVDLLQEHIQERQL